MAGDLPASAAEREALARLLEREVLLSRILPLLDFATIRANPKPFVGYSDVTALLVIFVVFTAISSRAFRWE